jgi:acetate kinase
MLGLTGQNDLREIEDRYLEGDPEAELALQMYAYRIKKYIGAYMAAIGRLDAIVFTAGVGEKSPIVRGLVCKDFGNLGIRLDAHKNELGPTGDVTEIQAEDSPIKILIIPTNEELEIANQTKEVLQ